ncbi:glutaredoxin 5 homolog (S. cerevisiae), isoform CRA_a, partial [Mus musculus]
WPQRRWTASGHERVPEPGGGGSAALGAKRWWRWPARSRRAGGELGRPGGAAGRAGEEGQGGGVRDYAAYNVLDDPELRQGIKDYSNWPTIPQVYLNGEFVGGCDILLQMHQNGDLVEELKKLGIRSALVDEKDQDSK